MNVLVTGATGFLGRELCRRLAETGCAVTGVGSAECDLTRRDSLDSLGSGNFGLIVHCAAWTRAGDFCLTHPGEQWIVNQLINTHVLEWWNLRQPQAKMVCFGTSFSYAPGFEAEERNYLLGLPQENGFAYTMTKRMLYVGLDALKRQFGRAYLYAVPDTLYGPGYHTDGRPMHLIFDLIRKIARGKLYGEPVVLWGDGNQQREVVYIDDFAGILVTLALTEAEGIINIAPGEQHTIRELAGIICEKIGYDPSLVRFDASRGTGQSQRCLNVDRLRSLLPSARFTPLERGIDATIQWFLQEKDILLKERRDP